MASLAVAPLLLVAAFAANQIGEGLVAAGQVDRAAFGWFVVVPLVLLSPGAAALVWQATGRRHLAGLLITGMSLAIGLVVEVVLALTVRWVGCAPVHDPLDVVGPALPIALAAAAAFGLSGIAAMVSVGLGGRARLVVIRTVSFGAIGLMAFGVAALFVLASTFAGTGVCAAPQ